MSTKTAGLRQNQRRRTAETNAGDPMHTLHMELAKALRDGISRPPRSYREWLESCVVIPDGKYKGLRFSVARQPVIGLFIDAIDSGDYTEYVFTAPSQFGKTLIAFIGPLLYHCCEIAENYVLGVPFADMAGDKWDLDVKPVMQSSPHLRRMLPISGSGSAGGKIRDRVTLRNGVEIKLMSAGADDTGKAGFTSRVLGVTEAARFSAPGETSTEADPLRQLRARQRSYEDHERCTYVEGTVTIEEELPWALKPISTDSKIMTPCPHCEVWVAPERDDLIGWDAARSDREAAELAFWSCPNCGHRIEEHERKAAVLEAKLVHRGQTIDRRGRISGDGPDTSRLFFRAAAFHNLFLSAGSIGKDEWLASQIPEDSPDRFSADRQLCQFVHCIPYISPMYAEDLILDKLAIGRRRIDDLPERIVPADTQWLTAGVDVGEKKLWWLVLATRVDAEGNIYRHVVAYGDEDVPSDRMDLDQALISALGDVHKLFRAGFVVAGSSTLRQPDQEWYDCNFQTDTVLGFVRAINKNHPMPSSQRKYTPFVGAYGRGQTTMAKTRFTAPRKTGNVVRDLDPSGLWYLEKIARARTHAVFWDSDTSKWQAQQALTLPLFTLTSGDEAESSGGDPVQTTGSVSLYSGTVKIHERFSRHVTNERLETKDTGFRGKRRQWVRHGDNHLLDCLAMAWRAVDRAEHIASKILYLPPTVDPDDTNPTKTPPSTAEASQAGGQAAVAKKSWYDR